MLFRKNIRKVQAFKVSENFDMFPRGEVSRFEGDHGHLSNG